MCDCIQRIQEDIQDSFRTDRAFIIKSNSSEVKVTPMKNNGEYWKRNRRYVDIPWKYCPFCGEKK